MPVDLYQEIKTKDFSNITKAIQAAFSGKLLSVTIDKRGDDYIATFIQGDEPPNS